MGTKLDHSTTQRAKCRGEYFDQREREKVTEELKKLHNEELCNCNVCCSPNIIRVIKSRRVRWVGYVVHKGDEWLYMHSFSCKV